MVNGIYSGFFTGVVGNSFGLFLLKDGVIAGADAGGATYDGQYEYTPDRTHIVGTVTLQTPANTALITGLSAHGAPLKLVIPIKLPVEIKEDEVFRIETSAGPVNTKFKKIRALP